MPQNLRKLRAQLKKALRNLEAALDSLAPGPFDWDPRYAQITVRWVHEETDSYSYYEFDPRIGELLEGHRRCRLYLGRLRELPPDEQSEAFDVAVQAIHAAFRRD